MGKTKSARLNDEELIELLEDRGERVTGGDSEVIRRALRNHLYEEKLGLSDGDYGELVEKTGDYFADLLSGNPPLVDRAINETGEEIYEIHREFGDLIAKVTVYLEETGQL